MDAHLDSMAGVVLMDTRDAVPQVGAAAPVRLVRMQGQRYLVKASLSMTVSCRHPSSVQLDPFGDSTVQAIVQQSQVLFSLEGAHNNLLLTQPVNRGWIVECFGEDIAKQIELQPVACSGGVPASPCHGDGAALLRMQNMCCNST